VNDTLETADNEGLVEKRRWFRSSVQQSQRWRDEGQEDYRFVAGEQWDEDDRKSLNDKGRPTITINVTRPLINLVCGYQSSNRYEPDFLPRNDGDEKMCQITKGVTKWVTDQTEYDTHMDDVFRDCIICGKGYLWCEWEWDYEAMDGKIKIDRQSPFDIYIDPECIKDDLSDARFIVKATWEDKDKIAQVYPEFKDEIKEMNRAYDSAERIPTMTDSGEPIWYSSDFKKIRVVQMWYRSYDYVTKWVLEDKTVIEQDQADEIPNFTKLAPSIGAKKIRMPINTIKCCTFCEDVVFEDIDSPYKHGMFPLVQQYAYHTNERDVPQGIVRDLKDPQREINKLRSQRMHIVNTMANRIWMSPKGALDESDKRNLRDNGSTPGTLVEYSPVGESPHPVDTTGIPTGFVQMEEMTRGDIRNISGINEELLGSDLTAAASGRAIELRQKQAMTQIAVLFDNQRKAQKQILKILWGDINKPGLIPQYLSEEKVIRIVGADGKPQFANVAPTGQAVTQQPQLDQQGNPQVDQQGQLIMQEIYDLSKFEFDIVISETPETATTRLSNFYALVEAQKAGVQIPPDIMIEFMDFAGKDEIVQRMKDEQMKGLKMPPPTIKLTGDITKLPPEVQGAIYSMEGIQINPQSIAQTMLQNNPPKPQNTQLVQPPQQPNQQGGY
jgi:hypothetical protein